MAKKRVAVMECDRCGSQQIGGVNDTDVLGLQLNRILYCGPGAGGEAPHLFVCDECIDSNVEDYMSKHREALLKRYKVEDEYFAFWIHYLNRFVMNKTYMQYDDLEDWDFASAYESDQSPKDAADEMLDDLGYDFESDN